MDRATYQQLKRMTLKERLNKKWTLREIRDSAIEVLIAQDKAKKRRQAKRFV
jgi:hypothetical protein